MKIKIKDIPNTAKSFKTCVAIDDLAIEDPYWSLTKDVNLEIVGYRVGEYVKLEFVAYSEKKIVCTRCLEEKSYPYKLIFSYKVKINDELEEIDAIELLREEIILNIGIKQLCSEECQGICTVCGGNKNKGECRCND